MKAIKYIIFVILIWVFAKPANAQQAPFYTQYMFNDYLINPAVAGTYNFFQMRANQRIQWMGITDAPRTMSIAGYGPFKDRPMGYGGYIYNDVTGPESRLFIGGSYAYNIAINDAMRVSGGLTIGLMQYKIDYSIMNFDDEIYDPVTSTNPEARFIPDASIGFYLNSSEFYVGISAHQLFGNKYNTHEESDSTSGISRLTQHLYLAGGYILILNKDFTLDPSALIKYTSATQIQAEINAKVTWQRMVWAGLTYRTSDAISILAGYNYENKIYIGLSYDITTSELRKHTSGTIEVMLGYRFNTIK